MKITIDNIVNYDIEIDKYYSNDIFSFNLAIPNLFEQRFQLVNEKYLNKETRVAIAIKKECILNDYDQIGDIKSIMKLNMKHVYSADKYFTNGQNLISLLKDEEGFELGIHKNLKTFANYFFDTPNFNQLSLSDLRIKKYEVIEKAESEIMRILSKIETTRIPIENATNGEFLEIRKIYPSTYFFTSNNQTIIKKTAYKGDWIDKVTKDAIEFYKPLQIKCCLNCKHFDFSAMSHDSSGGFTGYCFIVREKLKEVTVNASTSNIWNWCSKFEIK